MIIFVVNQVTTNWRDACQLCFIVFYWPDFVRLKNHTVPIIAALLWPVCQLLLSSSLLLFFFTMVTANLGNCHPDRQRYIYSFCMSLNCTLCILQLAVRHIGISLFNHTENIISISELLMDL